MTSGLVVLHEDRDLLAVAKPAGTLVIPGRGVAGRTLKEEAEEHCGAPVWVVHRLDREAGGVVVFAKTAAEHRRLCGLFERREAEKVYWALVRGRLDGAGEVTLPLKAFGSGRIGTSEGGLASLTRYRSLELFPDASLLEVRPLTGRRHQIRVHLHALGHPILGDPLYGRPLPVPGAPRLMLHALELGIPAGDGRRLRFRAEPTPDFTGVTGLALTNPPQGPIICPKGGIMAIIDRVKYDGPSDVLIWRHPPDDLSWGTQVIVNQSQEALFYEGGKLLDLLGPGTHTLKTANIPLLRALVKVPFGGETPFAAEIYFINKAAKLDIKWGTPNPIPLLDPKYNVALPVRAFGQFGVRVSDSKAAVVQLSGTLREYTVEALNNHFRGVLLTRAKDYLAEAILKQKIPVLEINAYLDEISSAIQKKLEADFSAWGFQLVNFYLSSVDVPENDDTVIRLKKALAEKAEVDILGGEFYKTKRTFDTLEKAAGTEGGGMGAGMGLGMGLGAGAGVGGAMGGLVGGAVAGQGRASVACASCKAENPAGSKFCSACGKPLGPAACPSCKAELAPGAKFCQSCGKPASN